MSVDSSAGITTLPVEMLSCEVFRYLTPQFLAGRVSLVCKNLRNSVLKRVADDYVKIIGRAEYGDRAAGLDFEGLVPMTKETAALKVLPFFAFLDKLDRGIEDDAGVAIIDIPANLSLTALGAFPRAERSCDVTRAFTGDCTNPKAYRIMISRHVLNGTRTRNPFGQSFFATYLKCRLPKVLEVCTLFLTTFANSSVSLFGKGTTTICHERFGETMLIEHLKIGNFSGLEGFDQELTMVPDEIDRGAAVVKELKD